MFIGAAIAYLAGCSHQSSKKISGDIVGSKHTFVFDGHFNRPTGNPYATVNAYIVDQEEMFTIELNEEQLKLFAEVPEHKIAEIKKLAKNKANELVTLFSFTDGLIYCQHVLKHGGDGFDKRMYGVDDFWASLQLTHDGGKKEYLAKGRIEADCEDSAFCMIAFMSDEGQFGYFLDLWEEKDFDKNGIINAHVVYPFREKKSKRFGSVGINDSDCHAPTYKSLDDLVGVIAGSVGIKKPKWRLLRYDVNGQEIINTNDNLIIHDPIDERRVRASLRE